MPGVDQADQPASRLPQQIMSDVEELTARYDRETGPRGRMASLPGETSELAAEVPRLAATGPYDPLLLQRIGREIYDVPWNACDLARLTGIDVVQAAAGKRDVNASRRWPDSEGALRPSDFLGDLTRRQIRETALCCRPVKLYASLSPDGSPAARITTFRRDPPGQLVNPDHRADRRFTHVTQPVGDDAR
jgi:NTP pyrophosphatase (non-canonical NTP hydrolase)